MVPFIGKCFFPIDGMMLYDDNHEHASATCPLQKQPYEQPLPTITSTDEQIDSILFDLFKE
jgi:hypothetical protein